MMKRVFTVLMILTLLLSSIFCLADGNETSKPITFMNFVYGDSFRNIRNTTRILCIDFKYGNNNARVVADALYDFTERDDFTQRRKIPSCFFARTSETFKVAGHDVGTMLWFVYPFKDGIIKFDEAEAVFYAGVYESILGTTLFRFMKKS